MAELNPYRAHEDTDGLLTLLRPEDAKRLADEAWRYIWARNPVTASRLWRKYHPDEMAPEGCVLIEVLEAA